MDARTARGMAARRYDGTHSVRKRAENALCDGILPCAWYVSALRMFVAKLLHAFEAEAQRGIPALRFALQPAIALAEPLPSARCCAC